MADNISKKSKYYPDVQLFLILIPLISGINYHLTYVNIKFNGFFLLTYTIDTAQGFLAWWLVRKLILYLDLKLPFVPHTLRRIIIQVLATWLAGAAVIALTTELLSWSVKGEGAYLSFYTQDMLIISIWFLVINGIYIGLHYYREWQLLSAQTSLQPKPKVEQLLIRHGKQDVVVPFNELAGLAMEEDYVAAIILNGKKYFLDPPLDRWEKELPAEMFFRLNRQYLLNRSLITGFRREENGKLAVLIQGPTYFPPEIMVSRLKAPAFKSWFRPIP